jgi:acetyl-CoA C-acetyltransferase
MGDRQGHKFGDIQVRDHMAFDGLTDPWDGLSMGESTDRSGESLGISRAEQDAYAALSHQRAAAAQSDGRLAEEIVGVSSGQRAVDKIVDADEGVRSDATAESLGTLRPAFRKDGTITAGSSSPISDGAAAVVVMSKDKAEELGLTWLAEIVSHGTVAGPDSSLHAQPANAIKRALEKAGRTVADLDLIEINEAFSQVVIHSMRELKVNEDIVNVNGGAIALGHPIGMSGTRIVLTLALELKRRGGGTGAASACGGGGQGDALIIEVPAT